MTAATSPADALAERLFGATLGALELFSVYLGAELGLYRTLADHGPLSPPELAERAGIAPRYAREWLEQQAVAGLLEVDDPEADAEARRFRLPAEHGRVLAEPDDPVHVAPLAHLLAGIGRGLPRVMEAYRTGGGVPYADYGREFRYGQGHINRSAFTAELPAAWLAAMPDVVARLESARRPRIGEVGCGQGWASLALAGAFPNAWVDGLDLDPESDRRRPPPCFPGRCRRALALHRGRRERAGRDGPRRPRARPRGVTRPRPARRRSPRRPRGSRRRWCRPGRRREGRRRLHGPGRRHRAADVRLERRPLPADPARRAAIGGDRDRHASCDATVRAVASEAGFGRVDVLPIETDFFRLYRLWT